MLGGSEATQRLQRITAADVAGLSITATRALAVEVNKLRGFLDRVDVELARRVRDLATSTASAAPADVLEHRRTPLTRRSTRRRGTGPGV